MWGRLGIEALLSLHLQGIAGCVMAKRIVQLIGLFSYFQILRVSVVPMLPADLCLSFYSFLRQKLKMKHILFLQNCAKIHLQKSNVEYQNISGMTPWPSALKENGDG